MQLEQDPFFPLNTTHKTDHWSDLDNRISEGTSGEGLVHPLAQNRVD